MTITDLPDADIASAPFDSPTFRFDGIPLPRGLREDADAMSWSTFTATYAPSAGPLQLGHWECADAERPATRLGSQARNIPGHAGARRSHRDRHRDRDRARSPR